MNSIRRVWLADEASLEDAYLMLNILYLEILWYVLPLSKKNPGSCFFIFNSNAINTSPELISYVNNTVSLLIET